MANRLVDLRAEYEELWRTMTIRPDRQDDVEAIVDRILSNRERYEAVECDTGVPWDVIGCIHSLESSLSFHGHLHNGDPLSARTVHVPQGRPREGRPPFEWEDSAIDALLMKSTDQVSDFSIPECLWYLERYNGFGYRGRGRNTTPPKRSPYLWSFTNHHIKGKFIQDGVFSPTAISKQAGSAAILRLLRSNQIIDRPREGDGIFELDRLLLQGVRGLEVAQLQKRLNDLSFDLGEIDAQFGPRTRRAVIEFQRSAGLVQDGVVGPLTWQALFAFVRPVISAADSEDLPQIRRDVLAIAAREAAKGRSHVPGNELDREVLDPLRPIMVELGHLGSSQTDTFYNWCAAWVTYICRQAGIAVPDRYGSFFASVALVDSWRHMGRRTGAWFHRNARTPRPGDIITFNWDGDSDLDHIGIFKSFTDDLSVLTFEGNKDNREGEFSRGLSLVDGFIDIERLAEALREG